MSRFIKARQEGHAVIYTTEDGKEFKYSGGNWNWRNNNPGNLVPGKITKRNGAIGKAGGFAVFPDYETGHEALVDSLRTTHGNKSLKQMIVDYAPEGDGENKPMVYLRFLQGRTGVKDDRKIKDFSSDLFEKLWRAIEEYEGKKKGKIEEVTSGRSKGEKRQITQVRKNKKGTIIAYNVEGIGWVSKARGIELASRGEVDAVVATSRAGNLFLRTRPSIEIVNLEDLG